MKSHGIVTLVVAVLLLIVCLVPSPRAADADGVMMHDGKMMMMHEGKPAGPMDHEMTMSNGARVEPSGAVEMRDGTEMHMHNGQMMMMNGHIMEGGHSRMMEGSPTGGMSH
jgi:hypothetical protein